MVSMRPPISRGRVAALAACAVLATAVLADRAGAAATLEAALDRQVVHAGDTVRLTLRYGGDAPPARPDLRPLTEDFEIVGTEQSSRLSVVNGRVEQTRALDVVLLPRQEGTLTVPALTAGDLTTAALSLTVLDAAASAAPGSRSPAPAPAGAPRDGDAPDLFVAASADHASPFVQGEVGYTVRVYDGIGIREGALTEPAADGVRVEPRGDSRTFEELVNGRRYVVHERQYALFPQDSGEVTIPPVILQARVADPDRARSGRRSAFDGAFGDDVFAEMFAQMRAGGFGGSLLDRVLDGGREVRVRSNPVSLSVQGRPADAADGWFLPARAVHLAESWRPAQPSFRVGETVRRTVSLRAEGASAAQLPQLALPDVAGVKQYPGRAEQRTVPGAAGPVAELVQTFDLLPTKAGTVTLPRIEVPWWDVVAQETRTAVLPEQTIEVLPAPGAAAAQAATAPVAAAAAGTAATLAPEAADDASTQVAAPPGDTSAPSVLGALADRSGALVTGALLLALLGATGWWWRARRRKPASGVAPDAACTAPRVPARALVDALHQACVANDARAVRDALLGWGRATWPAAPPANAAALARRLASPALARAIRSLDDSLYAPSAAAFDGDALWRAFGAARHAAGSSAPASRAVLPALYPDSRVA